jgi:hypothetical protein
MWLLSLAQPARVSGGSGIYQGIVDYTPQISSNNKASGKWRLILLG